MQTNFKQYAKLLGFSELKYLENLPASYKTAILKRYPAPLFSLAIQKLASQYADELVYLSLTKDSLIKKHVLRERRILAVTTELPGRLNLKLEIRRIRNRRNEIIEQFARQLGLVGSESKYASFYTQTRREKQLVATQHYLESTFLKCDGNYLLDENNKLITLADIRVDARMRTAEIHTVNRGLQEIAKSRGMVWTFVTATLPPGFHSRPESQKSRKNHVWNGVSARQGSQILMQNWARSRARFKKADIEFFGVRTTEPHKDGTPHAHFLIFHYAHNQDLVDRILIEHFGNRDQNSRLNKKYPHTRFDTPALRLDSGSGSASAASYIFKYVNKNIKNSGVDAWRSVNRIRSFQYFGLSACFGVRRAVRRLGDYKTDCEILSATIKAACSASFFDFFNMLYRFFSNYKIDRGYVVDLNTAELINYRQYSLS